ncbi:Utp20p [Saccharomyces eubayanus]|uniref:Utp20p n=1 Tax=Saccharomyces eubayanus TaxID=1080349 RepID=UPI0006C0AC92|nr:UTP20-like protein [Saccharomyces eubayanus]KOH00840.1 UTP20-like protein [Saccharomyces eubayanus]
MAKQKQTTKSSKRYRYSSFKARIDDLKIEPARNLEKRVHDYVESSHFLASFDQWKEINLSAKFTEFTGEIERDVQTLPQILYHDEKIFNSLVSFIDMHDEFSLQPLLDLLAQFCHDLGPDFLKFYEKAIETLINLLDAAIEFESSNVFEWGFNCLAYIFKYLSKFLVKKLVLTCDLLIPLLSHTKEYLSRFSAEALSFLVRKAPVPNLSEFVRSVFGKLEGDNEQTNIYEGLLILFTESMTSTQETLHSKAKVIMGVLLQEGLAKSSTERSISLLSDIWMNISKYASIESLLPVYDVMFEKFNYSLDTTNIDRIVKVLATIIFSESGRKIPDWNSVTSLIEKLMNDENSSSLSPDNVAFLFAVFLRNSDVKTLTQFHQKLFNYALTNIADHFLEFFKSALKLNYERVLSFNGLKFLQLFLKSNWESQGKKIALFFLEIDEKPELQKIMSVTFPEELISSIRDYFVTVEEIKDSNDLFEIYWRAIIFKFSKLQDSAVITSLLARIFSAFPTPDNFTKDTVGALLRVYSKGDEALGQNLLKNILENYENYKDSLGFVSGWNQLLSNLDPSKSVTDLPPQYPELLLNLTDNLVLPDGKIRYETFELMKTLMVLQDIPVPDLLSSCMIIEQIPLTLQNARDLTIRIKNVGVEFGKTKVDKLTSSFFLKYLFGLLTVRFSPAWTGVFDTLPNVYTKDQALVWSLVLSFIKCPEENRKLDYYEPLLEDGPDAILWDSSVVRLRDTIDSFSQAWYKYSTQNTSIISTTIERRGNIVYPALIRNQALKVMLSIPQVAEAHFADIAPFVFTDFKTYKDEEDMEDGTERVITGAWMEADRNLFLKSLSKFKNIKNVHNATELHDHLMVLLGSRNTDVQKLALDALLAYKNPTLNKYRDNLRNLLDDTLFKDEITTFLTENGSQTIKGDDEKVVMPYILRIFFGRAQVPPTSGQKRSRKIAVISVLPNFKEVYINDFLTLASERLDCNYFFNNNHQIDSSKAILKTIRRMTGFINILNSALSVLRTNFPLHTTSVLQPLIYSISMAYYVLETESATEVHLRKMAANLRQQGLKCLSNIFEFVGTTFNWPVAMDSIFAVVVKPRIPHFSDENLQQPSSLLRIFLYWANNPSLYPFLYYDEFAAATALMDTISNEHVKETVISPILEAADAIIRAPVNDDRYVDLVTLICSSCLKILPSLYTKLSDSNSISIFLDLLISIIESDFIQDDDVRSHLISSLTSILKGKLRKLHENDTQKILKILKLLVYNYDCCWNDIEELYSTISSLFKTFDERNLRVSLAELFVELGRKVPELGNISKLVAELNSYSSSRLHEYDFPRILSSFKTLIEGGYKSYSEMEWLPLLFTCLYFINDKEELALRTNASHTMMRFVDFINEKPDSDEAKKSVSMLKDILLPSIRAGLRQPVEEVQSEYISVLSYMVRNAKYFTDFEDMTVLLYNGDEEADFFTNINHVQLHRRQRAIKRLGEHACQLKDNSISHYLIPMIEHYVFSDDERYRNIGNETQLAIGDLAQHMSWNQYKALLRRYISMLKSKPDQMKQAVLLIVQLSVPLRETLRTVKGEAESKFALSKFPSNLEEPTNFITQELYPTLSKILGTRDDETIIERMPIAEALVNTVLGLSNDDILNYLPSILTNICQVLRSKSEELRDAVRTTLGKISIILGAEYLVFMIKELMATLKRGSQIHVLSYTVHYILKSLQGVLKHSDLDPSSSMVVKIIMENIFGFAGEEKDSENYHTKVKEIKSNKSYDAGEILAANISLSEFGTLLSPVKALLMVRINLRNQNKLSELLRRYLLGLNHNSDAESEDILKFCHQLFQQSEVSESIQKPKRKVRAEVDEKEEFFLVNLNAKSYTINSHNSLLGSTLQKFALDLLRSVLARHRSFLTVSHLEAFIPFLRDSLLSENEGVVISTLRILVTLIKLEFSDESSEIFKNCARKVLNIIQVSPSTSSELCQMGLKFLSAFIRHTDATLKDTALSYVLGRVLPDLNEPSRQGLAFNFLKALVSKHIMLPELYDIMDTTREIMVTNHSKEIRDVSRSVYYQFLMEYDQSKGRLEKQFKFMVDNLQYPTESGRQSVMELINLIITKANPALLSRLSSSFFLALVNVSFNDDAPRCREMASVLLSTMLPKLENKDLEIVEKYVTAWLKQAENASFLNLGLRVYKIYLKSVGFEHNADLDEFAIKRIRYVLTDTSVGSKHEWDLVYSSLNTFSSYIEATEGVYKQDFKDIWDGVITCLLYPHSWVRQSAANLVHLLINNKDKLEVPLTDLEIQIIGTRILHQLGAPSIPENLANISMKTLVNICTLWKDGHTPFVMDASKENEGEPRYATAIDFMITRIGGIIRSDEHRMDSFMSKKACIQLLALFVQVLDEKEVIDEGEKILLPLYGYLETYYSRAVDEEQEELRTLANECLQILETKLPVFEFTRIYTAVKKTVLERRKERRSKRAILAVNAPQISADKKLRKHARSREKRKHEKDENGFYQRRNKRKRA